MFFQGFSLIQTDIIQKVEDLKVEMGIRNWLQLAAHFHEGSLSTSLIPRLKASRDSKQPVFKECPPHVWPEGWPALSRRAIEAESLVTTLMTLESSCWSANKKRHLIYQLAPVLMWMLCILSSPFPPSSPIRSLPPSSPPLSIHPSTQFWVPCRPGSKGT